MSDLNAMDWSDWTYDELLYRQSILQERLPAVTVEPLAKRTSNSKTATTATDTNIESSLSSSSQQDVVITVEKIDTHWDFLIKEMQWLAADFTAERKRHKAGRKKIANAVVQDLTNREQRRLRQCQAARQKQRKVANRHAARVQQWWTQLEKVIAYQQKIKADQQRQREMNQQLVKLVQLTERYTQQLGNACVVDGDMEQALQKGSRRSKQRIKDYAQLRMQPDVLYGESTDDSGSDATFTLETDSSDDETTLLQAETEEARERQLGTGAFVPDPDEIHKLRQEMDMPIEQVLQRFEREARDSGQLELNNNNNSSSSSSSSSSSDEESDRPSRKVHFAAEPDIQDIPSRSSPESGSSPVKLDPGEDADDDQDASDVEDYNDDDQDDYEMTEEPVDDETTMMEEEQLPQEMTTEEELALLQSESELPVEELRRRYAEVCAAQQETDEAGSSSDPEEMEEDIVDDDDEFVLEGEALDDETTFIAEEKMGRDMTYEEELALLRDENEIPIEQLRQMYQVNSDAGIESEQDEDEDGGDESGEGDESSDVDENDQTALHALVGPVRNGDNQDDEYEPEEHDVIDDETTMEAEEKLGREITYEEELDILKRESEMSIEELRAMYAGVEDSSSEVEASQQDDDELSEDSESDGEFEPDVMEVDDETTIAVEELSGREMTVEEEISNLNDENNMSLEELRALYGISQDETKRQAGEKRPQSILQESNKRSRLDDVDVKSTTEDANCSTSEGATMASVSRPFLLSPSVKLREYQHAGLGWLVSLQARMLNGILADGTCNESSVLASGDADLLLLFVAQRWVSEKHCKQYLYWRISRLTKASGVHT
jgi:hypothetical protein